MCAAAENSGGGGNTRSSVRTDSMALADSFAGSDINTPLNYCKIINSISQNITFQTVFTQKPRCFSFVKFKESYRLPLRLLRWSPLARPAQSVLLPRSDDRSFRAAAANRRQTSRTRQ